MLINLALRMPEDLFRPDDPAAIPPHRGEQRVMILGQRVSSGPHHLLRLPTGPSRQLAEAAARILAEMGLHPDPDLPLIRMPREGWHLLNTHLVIGPAAERLLALSPSAHALLPIRAHPATIAVSAE